MKRHGFTLIELLVVIAIIAILAAILFPVFARARAKAIQNNCLSNVKQLTLACQMYNSDNDEKFYFWQNAPLDWPDVMTPYIKNRQIFYCGGSNKYQVSQWPNVLYCQNSQIGAQPVVLVKQPSRVLMVMEADGSGGRLYGAGDMRYVYCNQTPAAYDNMTIRHQDGSNYGYVDGHAKWLKPQMIARYPDCGECAGGSGSCQDWAIYTAGTGQPSAVVGAANIQGTYSQNWDW